MSWLRIVTTCLKSSRAGRRADRTTPLRVEDHDGRVRLDLERLADRPARVEPDLADRGAGELDLLLRPASSRRACGPRPARWGLLVLAQATITTSLPSLPYASTSFWTSGSSARQGPHQVAQKSIRTTLPARSALVTVLNLARAVEHREGELGGGLADQLARRRPLAPHRPLAAGIRLDLGVTLGGSVANASDPGGLGRDLPRPPAELLRSRPSAAGEVLPRGPWGRPPRRCP